jgi:predicted ATPase
MIYLKEISLPENPPEIWPFTVPSIGKTHKITFGAPVTFIAGDNGSGKSTLLEALAVKLRLPAIGRADAGSDESLSSLKPLANSIKLSFSSHPKNRFFLRSEDFFNFVLSLSRQRKEMTDELSRVEKEYKGRSAFAKNQARSAFAGSPYQMKQKYGEDLLSEASHGESFLRLFMERIVPNGLYLLDEPEVPLSPLRQLSLLSLIMDMSANENCQFIIATHSPILLAYDRAEIISMDEGPARKTSWKELESVNIMKNFLNDPQGFIRRL